MTFSVVAFDSATGQLGVAVQSKAFAVGTAVPWAQPGIGAVATQSLSNLHYGPQVLALLKDGVHPDEAIQQVTAADPGRKVRQLAVVDAKGRVSNYTGEHCLSYAGAIRGDGWSCQGNLLAGPRVVEAMAETFATTAGPLGDRLIAALAAGQEAGGDSRGMQAAALLIVGTDSGDPLGRVVDLRVDDHHTPIEELKRLYQIQQRLREQWSGDWVDYTGDIVLLTEKLMQLRQIPSLQHLAEALGIEGGIRGRKISRQFRQAIFEALQA
jgi:uncharacterized Ntn-hydrolase superfamily protein